MKKRTLYIIVFLFGFFVCIPSYSQTNCWFTDLISSLNNKGVNKEFAEYIVSNNTRIISFNIASKSENKLLLKLDYFKKFEKLPSDELREAISKLSGENNNAIKLFFKEFEKNKKFNKYFSDNPTKVELFEELFNSGSKYVLKDVNYLEIYSKLNPEIRKHVSRFKDEKTGNTLSKFLDDCDDAEFLKYVNDPANNLQLRGFLAHKDGMISDSEIKKLVNLIDENMITNPKALEWLVYGGKMKKFIKNTFKGITWTGTVRGGLTSKTSKAYKELKTIVNDLDNYSIYSDVQLCLKGNCKDFGEYWIPDFVLVKKTKIDDKEVIEVIIVDAKLSKYTDWTDNQKVAKGMDGWVVKSIPENSLIKGEKIAKLKKGESLTKKGDFIKIYSDNNNPKAYLDETVYNK